MKFASRVSFFLTRSTRVLGTKPILTSRLNKTPPMGEPKATDIPEAAAAERTSLFRAASCQNQ